MNDALEYLLRATTIWSVLLLFYLVVRSRTGFGFQRLVLLGGWLFGLVVPLLPSFVAERVLPVMANFPSIQLTKTVVAAANVTEATEASWQLTDILPFVYAFGVVLFGARTLVQWWGVKQSWSSGRRSTFAGFPVYRSPAVDGPFAAFGCVFLPENGSDADLTHTALIHETAHLRARHHYDTTLLTLTSILLWFHPLAWVYRRLLAAVHEYQADAAVLRTVPARDYGRQLLHAAQGPARQTGLFSSPLKKRIDMIMNTEPKRTFRLLPLLTLVLLLAGLSVACSDAGESLIPDEEVFSPVPVLGLAPTAEVDEYPRLLNSSHQEGDDAVTELIRSIYKEVRYPQKARDVAYAGTVRATVVIGPKGKVNDEITMYRELSDDEPAAKDHQLVIVGYPSPNATPLASNIRHSVLVDEVSRTINALGDFEPITANGKPQAVQLELDFTFKLEE